MRFLREYDSAREEELRRLAERSIARLPSTLAKPIASLQREVEKENFSAGMNYALDFLEISVQYVGCCLFVLLQNAEAGLPENSRAMKAIVGKIDTKRSLSFGDWVNDIFNPAVRAAVKELPDNPLVKSLDRTLFSKGANRLLGTRTEPSVVRIRNEYKGHSTTLSNEIYRGVVFTLEPQVFAMLEALEPLQDFSFSFEGGHCLLHSPDGLSADLHPLVFRHEKGYEYVFQSLKDEEISYLHQRQPQRRLRQAHAAQRPLLRHSQGDELDRAALADARRVVTLPRPGLPGEEIQPRAFRGAQEPHCPARSLHRERHRARPTSSAGGPRRFRRATTRCSYSAVPTSPARACPRR